MIYKSIAIYTFIDDILKTIGHQEDTRRKVTGAEMLTTAIVAALYFGRQDRARGVKNFLALCRGAHKLGLLLENIMDIWAQFSLKDGGIGKKAFYFKCFD